MTRFVSTLGFSGHRVTRPIIAKGLTAGDRVVLVSPQQEETTAQERTEQAVRDVEETLSGVVHQLEVSHQQVEISSFQAVVNRISDILTDGSPPVVCLGAGATDIMLPTFVAALAHISHIRDVMMFSDIERGGVNPQVPNLTARIPGRTMDVFRVLAHQMNHSPMTVSDLAEAADRSVSTASRHVDALAQEGLAQKHRDEQVKTVTLTTVGRLFARNLLLSEDEM